MRVWDALASQKKPVRVYETPFIADVRLMAEAAQKRGGASLYISRDDRHAFMAAAAGIALGCMTAQQVPHTRGHDMQGLPAGCPSAPAHLG